MSDMLNGISSYYNTYATENTSANKLSDTLKSDFSVVSEDELMEACKEFEAYFIEQVFDAMQKTIPKSEDEESSSTSYLDMFQDTLTQEYASMASESNGGNGLGLAQTLYEQMKRNYGL